jgi:hypothetical protein
VPLPGPGPVSAWMQGRGMPRPCTLLPRWPSAWSWRAGSRRRKSMWRACGARAAIFSPPGRSMTPRSRGRRRSTATSGARCRAANPRSAGSTRPSRPHRLQGRVSNPPLPHHALRRIVRLVGAAPKYRSSTYLNAATNPMGARRRPAIWPNEPKSAWPNEPRSAQRSRRHFRRTHPVRSGCRRASWPNEPDAVGWPQRGLAGRTRAAPLKDAGRWSAGHRSFHSHGVQSPRRHPRECGHPVAPAVATLIVGLAWIRRRPGSACWITRLRG